MYYMNSLISNCGFDMTNCMFQTGSINHSWAATKFSRDIAGLYAVNCYIRKQILYFARLIIDEQRKVSSANICFDGNRHAC